MKRKFGGEYQHIGANLNLRLGGGAKSRYTGGIGFNDENCAVFSTVVGIAFAGELGAHLPDE